MTTFRINLLFVVEGTSIDMSVYEEVHFLTTLNSERVAVTGKSFWLATNLVTILDTKPTPQRLKISLPKKPSGMTNVLLDGKIHLALSYR